MSGLESATPRIKLIQRLALGLLVVAGVVNYIDRATLAVANPLIREELGLSIADMGYLLSAFLWAYAFAQLPTGAMVDRLGPRILLTLGLSLWSFAQLLGGLVQNFGQFFGARILLGIGEAPQFPTGARVVRDWFNQRDRGLATGVFNCASSLGTAIAAPLLTFLMLSFGWRVMFVIMGVAGLIVAAAWCVLYRNPEEMALTPQENVYRTQGDPPGQRTKVTFREWKLLFRFRTTWGMVAGYFGCIYLTWIYTAWLPGYLEIERHMSVKYTGWAAAVPFACGVIGGVFGGYIADHLVRRGTEPLRSRRIPAAIALLGTATCTVAAAYVSSNALAIVFISISLFLVYVTSTCAWALSSVAVPTNCTASIGAVQNFGGYLGGALAPTVTGLIVQKTGSFIPALVVGALIGIVSAGSYLFVVDQPITGADLEAEAEAQLSSVRG
ncbi:putative transporter [Bradyrhizobium sp. STM 3843]|uniref:MFS transporter n=1 Tax=Bradyrhizobium sp. STM 3843 TaxID=551947 RepID=UPI000240355C|nr:MFS transporter [Bradyrhizobium sp. STM 3843]CCE08952.1 putative transporter [Bradyrhizobium sp. STM 3843]